MNPTQRNKPRRSALYTPGANPRAMEKTRQVPADVFILDLEDAVAPDSKLEARQHVTAFLQQHKADKRELIVRVNGLDTPWCADDLRAVISLGISGILFPKINSRRDVERAEEMLTAAGAPASMQLWCMIETPLSILNLHAIAQHAENSASRMSVWVMGTNDLVKELRAQHTPDRTPMLYALGAALNAARAHGLGILDGVHNDIADSEGLTRVCEQGRAMGFDGKTVIHPSQVDQCNRIFSPDPEAVENARRIIAAFDRPENAGKGVLQVDGKMVELLHAAIARDTIAIADAIAALQADQAAA
ncbi:MAG TPA: CoA ester lyase [Noviherbaspirillum sp.]|uniref:HpcH/HpaI aldolase/citrate lyase family protein n=1 Tax=Noviherbaspirillum sp. TaxID=1926288 RepID=UPI002B467ACB|nr:CoA ester lyase [Noviherbaspirillum sp.]HJV84181.1 CoA ester lyase [Noviherbaspirillum sp.]